ncbi:MAG: hypothetical protein HGB08_01515 [Candidatus Moranbacteria bacterium]|nr:hypothetical protein [Candidatus Moranbacteria bacterium]
MTKKKEMSIDDLAVLIKKEFDRVDDRFAGIDKRFAGIDKRFVNIDKRFDGVEERLDRLEFSQKDIRNELNFMVHKFELKELEYRVEKLEKKFSK